MSTKALQVAFGVTVLENGLAADALDGIGYYTKALKNTLSDRADVALSPYRFESGVPPTGETTNVGSFQRQALRALITRGAFKGFSAFDNARIDLIHATDHFVPKTDRYPVVATLMDVIPLSHPQWVDYRYKRIYNEAWKRSFKWADRIITISEYSKSQIIEYLGVPESRVDVVHLGVEEGWFAERNDMQIAAIKLQYQLPEKYLLFVGTLQPRKNLSTLIRAHQRLPAAYRRAYPLVVVGRYGWGSGDLLEGLSEGFDANVRWLRHVPYHHLQHLMAGATGFVFPSLLEGFGLPVLEAFASGVPVAASRTSSLPEVAGDAAILFDPQSEEAIAEAMKTLVEDTSLRASLRARGRVRARGFSWERTAIKTLDAYRKAV